MLYDGGGITDMLYHADGITHMLYHRGGITDLFYHGDRITDVLYHGPGWYKTSVIPGGGITDSLCHAGCYNRS